MTVKGLSNYISDLPDDMEVVIKLDDNRYKKVSDIGIKFFEDIDFCRAIISCGDDLI